MNMLGYQSLRFFVFPNVKRLRTFPGIALGASLLIGSTAVSPAWSADIKCSQDKAIYASTDGYGLEFHPVTENAAALTHLFSLTHGTVTLDGLVMDGDEPTRSIARIMKDCPDGDVTGEDIRACTGFEGYVYAISATGEAANLTGEQEAASHLLLAGLGPSLAASSLALKLKLPNMSSDTFDLAGCAP